MSESTDAAVLDDPPTTQVIEDDNQHISTEDLRALLDQEKAERKKAEDKAATEARRRGDVERQLNEAHRTVSTTQEERFKAEEASLEAMIASAQAEADRLEADVTRLFEEGKYAEATRQQRAMVTAQTRYEQLQHQKSQLATVKTQPRPVAQPAKQDVDLSAYPPKTRAWIREHPEFVTDPEYQKQVMRLHHKALSEDHVPDTDAYFDYINRALEGDFDPEPKPSVRRAQSPSVPTTRSVATPGTKPGTVRLSPEEREAADMTMYEIKDPNERYKAYATNRQRLRDQGRMN